MSVKGRGGVGVGEMGSRNVVVSRNLALLLCFSSFFAGILFTNRQVLINELLLLSSKM